MIVSNNSQSRKKRKFFSRKKIMRGGQQVVAVNSLDTYVYVNINVNAATNVVTVNNITNSLVKTIATSTPGSVILTVDPSLSSLRDYTLFGYDGTSWVEIPRNNLDMGGGSVSLYGNVPGMLIRKQTSAIDKMASIEVSIPVPVNTYGNIMQFVNISTTVFPFTLQASTDTFSSNIYIQLIFSSNYPTANTKLSGWIPNYIPGLNLWLNASEPGNNTFTPNTGVKILNWTDKSGKNNHATAQLATAPMYKSAFGNMGMYFNGSTFFSGNISNTSKYSYTFIVARPDVSNSGAGRLLSLSAPNTDDSTSETYMGVSATSGAVQPTTKVIVMGLKAGSGSVIKYGTTVNGILTWTDANGAWNTGACSSIAYGMGLFVAVGNDTSNGVIKYSKNGIDWFPANMPAPGDSTSYGFFFNSGANLGGINTVIFTGSIWICGGLNNTSYQPGTSNQNVFNPGLAYSYDGINWFKNTTTLPFTGTGNCITSIATDGNLIILTGTLTPSMNYSYDGINWFNMPPGVKTASQVGNTDNTGAHAITYHPGFKMWLAGGDAGNTGGGVPSAAEMSKKIIFSYDGFTWNLTQYASSTTLYVPQYTGKITITRIFSLFINGVPQIVMSGPDINVNSRGAQGGPIISAPDSTVYGFNLNSGCSSFPANGSNPAEVSAVYYDGAKLYYGLQNPSSGSYLIFSTGVTDTSWGTIPAINVAVNAIVDNMGGDQNFRGNIYLNNRTTINKVSDTNATKPCIISAWEDGANTCVAINGTIVPSNQTNPAKFNISTYNIGKNNGTVYHNYMGYIYEIISYNVLLYSRSRFAVEGYLAWKWGIQSLLPTSHMYYNNAPTPYSLTTAWPKYFTDLQPILWLDAQDPNANESFAPNDRTFISTWYDKSGNNNHLTAPPNSEPMYTTNIIPQGGLQFNRYPYQSMSYVPVPQTLDTLSGTTASASNATKVSSNTPSNWIPGFGAMGGGNVIWATTYDAYGFMYLTGTDDQNGGVFQYDENNNQVRLLYRNFTYYKGLYYSVYVSPTNGYIYLCISQWNADYYPLIILVPDSFPTTPTTNYPTVRTPTLRYLDWNTNTYSKLSGFGANMFVDKNGNVYMSFFGGDVSMYLYMFPYSTNFVDPNLNDFVSTLCIKQIGSFSRLPRGFYSIQDNAITISQLSLNGRVIMYLDTMATFKGSISGSTLTVESITSGKIILGSSIDYNNSSGSTPESNRVKITALISGTSGGVGTYTLSPSAQTTVPSGTNILSILIIEQISLSTTTGSTTTNTYDGLLDLSKAADTLVITNGLNNHNYCAESYDLNSNTIFITKDSTAAANASTVRLKRVGLQSRQVVTMAGSINSLSPTNTMVAHSINSEKFPLEYGIEIIVNGSNQQIYDLLANPSVSIYLPLLIGNKFAYFGINNEGGLKQVVKITNFRANPSCMSGPLTLTGTAVSIFIVYSNRNSSKNIMPHNAQWNTPIVSLSSTDDFCVFIGGIGITNAPGGAPGFVLVITQIISGTLQQGATINTPMGGFISSAVAGTTFGSPGSYNVSIIQSVPAGTNISASNGIYRVYTGGESSTNGPQLGLDTSKSDFISLYANDTNVTPYRNSVTAPQTIFSTNKNMPASGIATSFTGTIAGTTLTVTAVSSGVIELGSIINIPGISTTPVVIAYGTNTFGFTGTYTLDSSLTVSTATKMGSTKKATRINASITGNVLTSYYAPNNSYATYGILQIGAILNIPGYTVKPTVTGKYNVIADGTGTYYLNMTFATAVANTYMTVTQNPIIPEILLLSSTSSSLTTRILTERDYVTLNQAGTFTPFKVSSIGLGLQPSNISRIQSLLPNYFFDGTICEVLIYNTDISTNFYRRQILEGYLAWKWGAQSILPSFHLYKSVAPNTYVKTAIPCGTIIVSDIMDTTVTVSWSNDNITGIYFFYVHTASLASITSNDATGPLPASSLNVSNKVIKTGPKSVRLTGLTALTTYYLRVQSVGSESYINTDYTGSFKTKVFRLAPYIPAPNAKAATPIPVPTDGPIATAKVVNPSFMVFDAYDNLYITWCGTSTLTYPTTAIYNIRILTQTGNVYSILNTAPNLASSGGNYNVAYNRIPIWVDKTNGNVYWSIYDTIVSKTRIYRMTPSDYPLVESNGTLYTTWTKLEIANITEPVTCMAYSSLTGILWASSSNGAKYYKIDITSSPATPPTLPVFGNVSQTYYQSQYFGIDGYDNFYPSGGTLYKFSWGAGTTPLGGPDTLYDIAGDFIIQNNTIYFFVPNNNGAYTSAVFISGSSANTPRILMGTLPGGMSNPTPMVPGCATISDPSTLLDLSTTGFNSDQLRNGMAVDSKSNMYVASAKFHTIFKTQLFTA